MMMNFKYPVLFFLLLSVTGCIPPKSFILGRPDQKDIERLPSATIHAGDECFSFPESKTKSVIKLSDWSTDIPFFVGLDEFIKGHNVRSFVVIQNDSILYDYYGEHTDAADNNPSYSIAKSFTSALIGIAISEGYIGSEKDLVSKYIPELGDAPQLKTLNIEHLLNQTSGIKYSLSTDAKIYYGNDVIKAIRNLKFEREPGTKQHYLNVNIQLLGIVLQRATGKHPAQYLEEKIWKPIQMCSDGIWTTDRKNKMEKTFCCMGATALDYAKFGRLYLNKGVWNGKQIIPSDWYEKSISRDTTNGSSFNYNYCWHIGLKEYGDYMAIGMYKQHIYIYPKKKLIIVAMNNRENKLLAERVNWRYVFLQIADQL